MDGNSTSPPAVRSWTRGCARRHSRSRSTPASCTCSSSHMHDVVVVGAGIAGLAAAWSLRDLDVLVLEESDRVGGRIRSERRNPYWLNFGAHVFAGPGTATDRLVREVGVQAVDIPGELAGLELDGRVVAGGRVETYPFRLPLSPRDRLAFVRAGLRLRMAVAQDQRVPRAGG